MLEDTRVYQSTFTSGYCSSGLVRVLKQLQVQQQYRIAGCFKMQVTGNCGKLARKTPRLTGIVYASCQCRSITKLEATLTHTRHNRKSLKKSKISHLTMLHTKSYCNTTSQRMSEVRALTDVQWFKGSSRNVRKTQQHLQPNKPKRITPSYVNETLQELFEKILVYFQHGGKQQLQKHFQFLFESTLSLGAQFQSTSKKQ